MSPDDPSKAASTPLPASDRAWARTIAVALAQSEQRVDPMLAVQSSEDLLETIGLCACDPLRPATACALAACCRGLAKVMRARLMPLRARHEEAALLAAKAGSSCGVLRDARRLVWEGKTLSTAHMRTLGSLLGSGGLPALEEMTLRFNGLGAAEVRALCEGLGRGAAPRLVHLGLHENDFGDEAADSEGASAAAALAAALGRGALPKLQSLGLCGARLGDRGLAALATPLRRLPALKVLNLRNNSIGDGGVAALIGGVRDQRPLVRLNLEGNPVSDKGCAALAAALDGGALPVLTRLNIDGIRAGGEARRAVQQAVKANMARRAR